jgi:hypothetical protein
LRGVARRFALGNAGDSPRQNKFELPDFSEGGTGAAVAYALWLAIRVDEGWNEEFPGGEIALFVGAATRNSWPATPFSRKRRDGLTA